MQEPAVERAWQLVLEKLEGWGDSLVTMVPNLIVALLVLALFCLLARVASRLVTQSALRMSARGTIARLLGTVVGLALIFVGLFIALSVLRLDKTVTSLLAGAGVLGLALGFAFQNIAANFLAGTLISLRRTYKEGDLIETAGYFGVIERIDLRVTRLRTPQGQIVLIPNKDVFENSLVNFTRTERRRIDVEVGVGYGEDLERASQVAVAAVSEVAGRDEDQEVELFYEEFGDSSINFRLRFWIPFRRQIDFLAARSEAILRIKRAFDESGINIPFPIRTLNLGQPGQETLRRGLATLSETGNSSSPAG